VEFGFRQTLQPTCATNWRALGENRYERMSEDYPRDALRQDLAALKSEGHQRNFAHIF